MKIECIGTVVVFSDDLDGEPWFLGRASGLDFDPVVIGCYERSAEKGEWDVRVEGRRVLDTMGYEDEDASWEVGEMVCRALRRAQKTGAPVDVDLDD